MSAAVGLMTTFMNNAQAQENASISYRRQNELMNKQNRMNLANAKVMPSIETEGLRMAGFNPAMVNGAGTQAAPTVSQGNADMPQTIPFNAQDSLVMAQIDKINAEKDLIKAQKKTEDERPENIKNDTDLKIAQTLLAGANKDKVDEETQNMRNINHEFDSENEALSDLGEVMAQKWKNSEWYNKLGPDTKKTIDAIANGDYPMSIGAMRAIDKVIKAQGDISDADRKIIDNAFANLITEAMWKDPKVQEAIAKMPKANYDKIRAELGKIILESRILKTEGDWKNDQYEIYKGQDPDKLYQEYMKDPSMENMLRWLHGTVNSKMNKAFDAGVHAVGPAAGGYLAGKAAGHGAQKTVEKYVDAKKENSRWAKENGYKKIPPGRKASEFLYDKDTGYWFDLSDQGIQNMKK